MEEIELRPAEALQRDYQRVLREQASAIKILSQDVEVLKQQLEFQLASMNAGLTSTKQRLDVKNEEMRSISQMASELEKNIGGGAELKQQAAIVNDLKKQVSVSPWHLLHDFGCSPHLAAGGGEYEREWMEDAISLTVCHARCACRCWL